MSPVDAAPMNSRLLSIEILRLIVTAQTPSPNIPITNRIVMVLQHERLFGVVHQIGCELAMRHRTLNFLAIMQEHAVVEDGHISGLRELRSGEARGFEHNIVRL